METVIRERREKQYVRARGAVTLPVRRLAVPVYAPKAASSEARRAAPTNRRDSRVETLAMPPARNGVFA
jgi:hypothetical protein